MTKLDKAKKLATELIILVKEKDEYAIGALMTLFKYQTLDEQDSQMTRYQNSVGFNALDAGFLSSLALQYQNGRNLTDKQITKMKPMLLKYCGQLARLDSIQPLKNNPRRTGKEKEQYRRVSLSKKNPDIILVEWSPFDYDTLSKVKTLPLRRFIKEKKWWRVPFSLEAVESLKEWNFSLSASLSQKYERIKNPPKPKRLRIKGLNGTLFPFQQEGVEFIESRNGRVLVGDEMGLGKTVQALAWLQHHPELRPVIIVVPASVKYNWEKEAEHWMTKPNIMMLSGRIESSKDPTGLHNSLFEHQIIIINYDILPSWVEYLLHIEPKVVVLDESHYIKNRKALRTKATQKLCKKVEHVIALSGTPIVNRPVEFFNVLNILQKERFPSFWKYAHEFCGAKHNGFGWDFTGASNIKKLHEILTGSVMVRRKKDEVLKDLPEKIRSIIPIEIDNRKEYDLMERNFREWLMSPERREFKKWDPSLQAEALTHIERMKQLCMAGKQKKIVEWIQDYLDTSEGKLVVFCTHQKTIDTLRSALAKYHPLVIDGRVHPEKRQGIVDAFQGEPLFRVFLGNIKAAGVGINLFASNATCFVELGWTPGEHDQAEDRVHRIGQEADSVMAYYLISKGTIEDTIADILDKKRKVLSEVLDGEEVQTKSMLMELLEECVGF